jgi:hypothetical protein
MKRFDSALERLLRSARIGSVAVAMAMLACSGENNDRGQAEEDDAAAGADLPTGGLDASLDDPNADAAAGGPVDGACGGTSMKATARDANLLLVVDRSGSMLQKPTGFAVKKWEAVSTALRDALTPVAGRTNLGLQLYPSREAASGNVCAVATGPSAIDVPVGPGAETLDEILTAVSTTVPAGATPTGLALAEAHAYFTTGAGRDLQGDKYVILATDGGPNCGTATSCTAEQCTTNIDGSCSAGRNCCDPATGGSRISCLDESGVLAQLEALKSAGVKTFVVGIPGTEGYRTTLDRFAEAGGQVNTSGSTKYFAVSAEGGVGGLTSVFAMITGELITSCRISLEDAAPDPEKINVYVDDVVVPRGGENGWELDPSTTPPSIVIKGSTCEKVKTTGARAISVIYGCPTVH